MVRNRQRPKGLCGVCGKRKLETSPIAQPINEHDPALYIISKCESCGYIHATPTIDTNDGYGNPRTT